MQVEHTILDNETNIRDTDEIPKEYVDAFRPFQFIDGAVTTAIRPNSYTIALHAEGNTAVIQCKKGGKTAITHMCCFGEAASEAAFAMVKEIISGTDHPSVAPPTLPHWIYSIVVDYSAMSEEEFTEAYFSVLFIYNALLLARQGDVRNDALKAAN